MFKWFRRKRPGIPPHFHYHPTYRFKYYLRLNIVKFGLYAYDGLIHINLVMTAIPNATLDITVTSPVGESVKASVVSNEFGVFSYDFVAALAGKYNLYVAFAGNDAFLASDASLDVVVVEPPKAESKITLNGPIESPFVGQTVSVSGALEF